MKEVPVKKLREHAVLPTYGTEFAAGADLYACLESPDFCISGFGWNASFKEVTSNRFDGKALKADCADLYKQYSRPQTSRRFLCKPVAVPA